MVGSLYLRTYDEMPFEKCVEYNISRKPVNKTCRALPGLYPTKELLEWALAHKHKEDWFNTYYFRYMNEVASTSEFLHDIRLIQATLDTGCSVLLRCWCRDKHQCHRYIIGKIINSSGYTVYYG